MEYFKKNKTKCLGITAIVLLALAIILCLVLIINPGAGNGGYGNRLNGIDEVKLSSTKTDDIVDNLKSLSKVENVEYYLKGRLMKYTIKLESGVTKDDLGKYTELIVDGLSKKELGFYDIQVIFESSDDVYPIFASKNKKMTEFSYTVKGSTGEASE